MTLVSDLPAAPLRSEGFSAADAEAFMDALTPFVGEMNALKAYVDARSQDASAVTLWVSGSDYAEGDPRVSPADKKTYRAKGAITNSTTDPSADAANWEVAGGVSAGDQLKLDRITATEAVNTDQLAKKRTRVADGAGSSRDLVARQSDGTAKAVEETGTAQSVGAVDAIVTADRDYSAVCYDRLNNKPVVFLADTAPTYGALKYSIGTQTGEDMVWSAEAAAYGSGSGTGGFLRAADDAAGNLLCLMRHKTALRPQAVLFSSDGSTLSQDDVETVNAATSSGGQSLCWDEDNSTWVCGFGKGASGVSGGFVVCVSASGGALTLHTEVQFETGAVDEQDMARDNTNDKILLVYVDGGNSDRLTACVLTISGYVVTANTPVVLFSSPSSEPVVEHDAVSGNFVVGYRDSSGDLWSMMVDVSGTVPNANTAVQIGSGDYLQIEQGGGGFVAVWNDSANSNHVSARSLTPAGTAISLGAASVIIAAIKSNFSCVENEDLNNVVVVCSDGSAAVDSIVITPAQTSTNANAWLGWALEDFTDGDAFEVSSRGDIVDGFTGLTYDAEYYPTGDGGVTATPNAYGKAGRAISTTEILQTGPAI
jgi:hypothetical protein